ncbi:MAG TPA: serine acetyltransferase [Usitatibacter sp.]|nr:serine acetyltransferase [Usitatibacter sp.]
MDPIFAALRADIRRTYDLLEGGRVRRAVDCARTPGVQALAVYRLGQWLGRRHALARVFLEPFFLVAQFLVRVMWGIELPRAARIGPGLYIGHFGGIIVSPQAVIGAHCSLSPGIIIGLSGQGDRLGVPVIGDGVYIAPGAKVIGRIRIGDNVKIGANAVVYRDIPDNAIVALDPGYRIISFSGNVSSHARKADLAA